MQAGYHGGHNGPNSRPAQTDGPKQTTKFDALMMPGGLDGLGRRTARPANSPTEAAGRTQKARECDECAWAGADLMLGKFGSTHLTWLLDGCFVFGSVARFRFWPTLPPFHPPTPWRTVSRADPARTRCFALLPWPWPVEPCSAHPPLFARRLTRSRIFPFPTPQRRLSTTSTNLVHFQLRISRFALAWPSTPLPPSKPL